MKRLSTIFLDFVAIAALVTIAITAQPAAKQIHQFTSEWFGNPPASPDAFLVDTPSVSIEYTNP